MITTTRHCAVCFAAYPEHEMTRLDGRGDVPACIYCHDLLADGGDPCRASAFGGRLFRRDGRWTWSDGTPAEGVQDLTAARHYALPRRRVADETYVELPTLTARWEEDLTWLHDEWRAGRLRAIPHPTLQQRCLLVLVPIERWEAWACHTVVGVECDPKAEAVLLAKARELGWDG